MRIEDGLTRAGLSDGPIAYRMRVLKSARQFRAGQAIIVVAPQFEGCVQGIGFPGKNGKVIGYARVKRFSDNPARYGIGPVSRVTLARFLQHRRGVGKFVWRPIRFADQSQ